MEKIIILGVNGFTGRHFQEYLERNMLFRKFSFFGIDLAMTKPEKLNYARLNLLDFKKLEKFILKVKPAYIINFSGIFNHARFKVMEKTNAEISRNILEIIARNGLAVKKVLLIGSAAEYGRSKILPIKEDAPLRPISFYGLSKVAQSIYCDYYVRNFDINVIIARTFNIIGRGISDSLCIGSFVKQIKKAKEKDTIYAGNLQTKRDFLDIEDVVDAYWKILMEGKRGEIYNVCSGRSHYIKDILEYMIKESGKQIKVVITNDLVRKMDIPDSFGDNRKLRNDTGWKESKGIFAALKSLSCR